MKRFLLFILCWVSCVFLLASSTQNGKLIYSLPYETQGQRNWFATVSGTGDCTSWDNACTLRVALSKCTNDLQDNIWLSPEDHDTDNGSDATGTTITANNVHLFGSNEFGTRIHNAAASVTNVLQITGDRVTFTNIRFNQQGDADVDMTLISVTGDRSTFKDCEFLSATGATADIGLLLSGTSQYHKVISARFDDFQTVAFRTNGASNSKFKEMRFYRNVLAVDITNAADDTFEFNDTYFEENTSAIETAAGSDVIAFIDPIFANNTTNITDGSDYNGLHLLNPIAAQATIITYPLNAGVTLTGGAGAYQQGGLTQIIPASTVITPFFVLGINIQSSTAGNVYKLELFYGEVTGDTTLGIFEFTDAGPQVIPAPIIINQIPVPSNSYIGGKLASSSGGGDTAVITLSYLAF